MQTLASYLADYIDHECIVSRPAMKVLTTIEIHELIKNGIEAYQSIENCVIGICGGKCPECNIMLEQGVAMLYNGMDEIEVCKYECPECGYIVYG